MKLTDTSGVTEVDILVDWTAFLAIVLAVILGMAIYEIAQILYDRALTLARDVWLDVQDWWAERDVPGAPRRLWRRAVGEETHTAGEPSSFVPDAAGDPVRDWPYRITGNGTLHKSTCRIVNAGLMFSPGYPWTWADNEEEARHYAEVQELRPCGACHPCGDVKGVEPWWR